MILNRLGVKKQNKISTKVNPQMTNVTTNDETLNRNSRQKLLADIAIKKENIRTVNIIGSKTTLYSYEDMFKLANEVIIKSSKLTLDVNNIRGTVNDPRMGGVHTASNMTFAKCQQCFQINCPGHYGLIKFYQGGWIINPIFIKDVMKVLQCVCNSCSSLLCCESTLRRKGILDLNNEMRLKQIYDICKKIYYCKNKKESAEYHCTDGTVVDIIKNCDIAPLFDSKNIQKEGVIKFYKRKEDMEKLNIPKKGSTLMAYSVEKVYSILNAISDRDAQILGFEPGSHPRNMILKAILVMPELSRPPVYEGSNDLKMDNLTNKYATIVTKNENIGKDQNFKTIKISEYIYVDKDKQKKTTKANKESKTELEIMNEKVHSLYTAYLQLLLNNNDAKTGKNKKTPAKEYKSVFDRIQGKEAILRSLLMGKRNDYCARTVASPDASLNFGQVSLPQQWKRILTKPVKINDLNKKYLEGLLLEGKIEFITNHLTKIRFEIRPENRYKYKLKIGDIVERHGEDGDRHIINRQPSLHKYSIMSYEVIYRDTLTIGHHISHTTPMNCDFDGDENNVWDPQNIEVEVECLEILNARKNIMSGQTNRPIMGLVMNSVTGSYLLSDPNVRLSRDFFKDILGEITSDEFFDTLNARLDKYGVHPLSGQALISCLLPDDFNYEKGSENKVIIREGVLINGRLTKGHVGVSDRSIIQEMWKKYGHKRITKFLTDAPRVINYWLKEIGFTVGIKDCVNLAINPETNLVEDKNELIMKDVLAQAYLKIDSLNINTKEPNKLIKELKENEISKIVDIAEVAGEKMAKETLQGDNAIAIMTEKGAGTKGAVQNIVQILGAVGQQFFQGKRFEFSITDGTRCLPAYDRNSTEPEARGFVKNSFFKGLSPEELFYIQAGCRENLTDTSLKTAITGRLEHLLIRSMENIKIANDGSVRNTVGYLFNPCYNAGYSVSEMLMVEDKQHPKLSSFIDIGSLIDDLNTEAGWISENIYNIIENKKSALRLELEQNPIVPIKFKSKNKNKKESLKHDECNRGYGNLPQKLSIYEASRIIWTRASQLENNQKPLIDVGDLIDAVKIAKKEFKAGILKIYIIRNMPDGSIQRVYPTKENIDYSIL